ncbi:hypothetical protein [Phormidium sp. FACHB-1136]|uniref:hypothetical protein n=1 Tax=Phormidium sp. FACHB-1136 TaxID=2692848 RepID=UPI001689C5AE|nr:hypothetical protein [Phormidium sp. FACHB-1136]MBD2427952.1 hypothetical protein [Phormidium sp. FACHB-1136]
MADPPSSPIRLELDLAIDQPGLLEGLEAWLRLGLLTEAQVLALAQTQLTCEVPPLVDPVVHLVPKASPAVNPDIHPDQTQVGETLAPTGITDFLPPNADEEGIFQRLPPPPSPSRRRQPSQEAVAPRALTTARESASTRRQETRSPSATGVWLNRLLGELSVIWLLGLGVFLVVLSSAVLAATQWARFNAMGQYLVLLAYTLAFWGVGLSCGRHDHLRLTAKTLGMITLLLVPLNVWAMDGLGVWQTTGGLMLGLGSVSILSLVTLQGMRQQRGSPLEQGNALGLAYLHWGWGWAGMPLLAVYLGVLGSAMVTLHRTLHRPAPPRTPPLPSDAPDPPSLRLPTLTLGISLGILLLRALTLAPPTQWGQFGLAFGLYAATWVWLGQRHLSPPRLPASPCSDSSPIPDSPLPPPAAALSRWPILLGRLLLVGSWLISITDWLAQAFGISTLGLGLRIQALQKLGKRRDLLAAHVIAIQLGFVGWELLPEALRQSSTALLLAWTGAVWWPTALLGISLFPYVIGLVVLGDGYYRHNRPKLGLFSDALAIIDGVLLMLVSATVGRVLVINLIASTVTAFVLAGRRTPRRQGWIVLSYGLTVATIVVTVGQRWPQLPLEHWAAVGTTLATVAILLSQALPNLWGKSAWLYGLGLSALTYLLLWWHLLTIPTFWQSPWSLLGLAIPVAFTLIRRHTASLPTTALALLFTLGLPWTRMVGLATAMVLSAINGAALRQPSVPFVTVAYGLGLVVATVDRAFVAFPHHWTDWYGVTAALVLALWGTWRILPPSPDPASATQLSPTPNPQPPTPLPLLYRTACDQWGHLLALGLLTVVTIFPRWLLVAWDPPRMMPILALAGLLLGLTLRYWGQVQPRTVYLAGWAVQLLVAEGMVWRWGTPLALAVPTLGLGALSLALATGLSRSRPHLGPPLQHLTLAYAGLALVLRSYTATAWTGWLVVGASLLILEVGRRQQQTLARWLAWLGLSVGWYELVLYPMLQAPAGAIADGVIVLVAVAAVIMVVYRLMAGRLRVGWGLPSAEILGAAHLHWFLGSVLMLVAGLWLASPVGKEGASLAGLGVGVATVLVAYALLQGRLGNSDDLKAAWVYAGLVELVGWFTLLRLTVPALAGLDAGWGAVACGVAVPIYWLPWPTYGWPQRPWQVMAVGVPLVITLITPSLDHIPSLWVLVGFYGWLAWHSGRVRVSYLSAAAAVWAVWQWLDQRSIQDEVLWMIPLGLTMIYIAQVDPDMQQGDAKTLRHWLRVAAGAVVLFPALGTAHWTGWPVGILSLGILGIGLFLRIRAFLYVGTLVFALNALNQLVLLNATYPFMKWVLGILLGIALIWIAADFERRRAQWLQMTQDWLQELDDWQ